MEYMYRFYFDRLYPKDTYINLFH